MNTKNIKIKKIISILVFVLVCTNVFAQKVITRNGELKFEGTIAGIEEIAATNKSVSCIFDQTSGEFVALALIKSFKFKSALMEEHFNENYLESNKFPKATFKGKVLKYDASKLTKTNSEFDLEGDLTIHGITKKVKVKINILENAAKVIATSNFTVKPADYKIEIPNLVKSKIAENIKVALNFSLEKQ
jgi:YceI-like domain